MVYGTGGNRGGGRSHRPTEPQFVLMERFRQLPVGHAGLDHGVMGFHIDLYNFVHLFEIQQNTASFRNAQAPDIGTGRKRHHRDFFLVGKTQNILNVLRVFRHDHVIR